MGFKPDKLNLNLQFNDQNILECRGRIEGDYPIHLPDNHVFTPALVDQTHTATLHGGVNMTIAKIRERYWVPCPRQLVKTVRQKCFG